MNTLVMDVKDVKVQEVLVYLEGNAMEMQERIISLLSSRNLKRSESLMMIVELFCNDLEYILMLQMLTQKD